MNDQNSPWKERLELLAEWSDTAKWLKSLDIYKIPFGPNAIDYDRAWRKHSYTDTLGLLALSCYYAEDSVAARVHSLTFLQASQEFFFGDWRNHYLTEDKRADPAWWKRNLNWIGIFELTLLWAALLDDWSMLKRLGHFPEPDSCGDSDHKPQDRDLVVAIGAFLRDAAPAELSSLLEKAATGPRKICKLMVEVLRACLARDEQAINASLKVYLKHYKKSEFPKQSMTKKVSIEGTFVVHWAEKEGMKVEVPIEFTDYIVRLE